MMKRFIFTLAVFVAFMMVHAQNATKILDKTVAALKAAGDVKINFVLSMEDQSSTGYIKLKENKFVVNLDGYIIWFDGETMWNYVKSNQEVNVTNPSPTEISRINPYAFLTFYKKGYSVSLGKSTSDEYEVVLIGNESTQYKKVVVRVNKSTYFPTAIRLDSTRGPLVTDIKCTSYLKNQQYSDKTFRFVKKNFPNVEIIDLR